MEADWAAAVGPGLDCIDADWPGFVDLRPNPFRVREITEASENSVLWQMLVDLNDPCSPVFSVKCDVWELRAEEIDPLEFDCAQGGKLVGMASYLDVISRDDLLFASFAWHERWAQAVVQDLRGISLQSGRVDLVIRAAVAGGHEGFGITLYAAGGGVDSAAAASAWEPVLRAAVAITIREVTPPQGASSSIG